MDNVDKSAWVAEHLKIRLKTLKEFKAENSQDIDIENLYQWDCASGNYAIRKDGTIINEGTSYYEKLNISQRFIDKLLDFSSNERSCSLYRLDPNTLVFISHNASYTNTIIRLEKMTVEGFCAYSPLFC